MNRVARVWADLTCAVLGLSLLACAGSAPPADVFHRLPVATPVARPAPLFPGVVEVDRLAVSDALRGRAMMIASTDRPGRLQRSNYHFWVDPPPVLLQDRLVAYLRALGAAERVVVPERRAEPRWLVSGRIERFERVVSTGAGRVEVSLELALREADAPGLRVHGVYQATEPAANGSADAAVDAFGRAVGHAFEGFLADVEAGLHQPGSR